MKFGQLILRIIVKIVATECQILMLKCTKIDIGWGSAPDPAGGAYSAPPDLQLDLRKGGYRKGREGEKGGEGMGEEKGRGKRKGGDPVCIFKFFLE